MKNLSHLYLRGILGSLSLALLGACNDPTTYQPSKTDKFTNYSEDNYTQASKLLQADYLVVMDYSFSMLYSVEKLNTTIEYAFQDFAQEVLDEQVDARMAFVKGAIQSTGSLNQISQGFVAPYLSVGDNFQAAIEQQFNMIGEPLSANKPYMLESALRSLKNEGASFLRPSAQLVLLFLSDNEDSSSASASDYINAFRKLKPNPAYVSARAIVAHNGNGCQVNPFKSTGQIYWQKENKKTKAVVNGLDLVAQNNATLCINNDLDLNLSDVARNINKVANRFLIQGNPDPASIVVSVNGDEQVSGVDYDYLSATNEIVFRAGKEPDFDASVNIDYDMIFALSEIPVESTIDVSINGNPVAKDSSSGWTYDSAKNRILFHGSAKPSQGDEVRVSYKALII